MMLKRTLLILMPLLIAAPVFAADDDQPLVKDMTPKSEKPHKKDKKDKKDQSVPMKMTTEIEEKSFDTICGRKLDTPQNLQAQLVKEQLPIDFENGSFVVYLDEKHLASWSFSKPANKAYPAVVCRQGAHDKGKMHLETRVMCAASKADCDQLVADYIKLNSDVPQ